MTLKDKIEEVLAVCQQHGISISHQDSQGAFVIERWSKENADWLRQAEDGTANPTPDERKAAFRAYRKEVGERIRREAGLI